MRKHAGTTLGIKMPPIQRMSTLANLRKKRDTPRGSAIGAFTKNRLGTTASVWKKGLSNRDTAAWSIAPGELPSGSSGAWVKASDIDNCMVCHRQFTAIHRKHHCRNCGNVICGACSEHKIRLKKGEHPRRVCTPCYHQKLHAPRKTSNDVKTRWITVPEWVDPNTVNQCFKCHRHPNSATNRHLDHCRACGNMYCQSCYQDTEVPLAFRKMEIQGPVPVCDLCTAAIKDGAELVDEEPLPPPEEVAESMVTRKGYVLVLWERKGQNDNREKKDEDVVSSRSRGGIQSQKDEQKKEENEFGVNHPDFIAKVPAQPNTPLPRLHQFLLRKASELDRWNNHHTAYSYVCNGHPIPRSHYQVFEARHFTPALYVRTNIRQRKSLVKRKQELHDEFLKQQEEKKMKAFSIKVNSPLLKKKKNPETTFTAPIKILATNEHKGLSATDMPPGWGESKKSNVDAYEDNICEDPGSFMKRNEGVDMSKIDKFSKKAAERFGLYLEKDRTIEDIDIMDDNPALPPPPLGPPPKLAERPKRKPSSRTEEKKIN